MADHNAARAASRAVSADQLLTLVQRQPGAVLHQKAARAGELVGLLRYHPHREFFPGQIAVRQYERVGSVVVDVDDRGVGIGAPPGGQLVQ